MTRTQMTQGIFGNLWFKAVPVIAALTCFTGQANQAQAQWIYAPPVGYAVPAGYVAPTPVYAYRPVTVFSAPSVVVAPVAYEVYSAPIIVGADPSIIRERYRTGLFGAQIYNQNARGPGYGRSHIHSRDGWLGYSDYYRYHY